MNSCHMFVEFVRVLRLSAIFEAEVFQSNVGIVLVYTAKTTNREMSGHSCCTKTRPGEEFGCQY